MTVTGIGSGVNKDTEGEVFPAFLVKGEKEALVAGAGGSRRTEEGTLKQRAGARPSRAL